MSISPSFNAQTKLIHGTDTSGRSGHLSSVMTWKRSLTLTITNRCGPIKYGTRK